MQAVATLEIVCDSHEQTLPCLSQPLENCMKYDSILLGRVDCKNYVIYVITLYWPIKMLHCFLFVDENSFTKVAGVLFPSSLLFPV